MKMFKHSSLGSSTLALFAAIVGFFTHLLFGPPVFRARTCDIAFGYRMGVGFPGDVNRTHPFSVLPGLINTTNPPRAYGEAVLFGTTNDYRAVIAADQSATAQKIAGVMVRPYPTQQQSGGMSSAFGTAVPPTSGVGDFLHQGFILVKGKAGMTVKKGDPCYIWAIATAGANIQGEFQAAATASSTVLCSNARYNGPADANGNVEIEVWSSN